MQSVNTIEAVQPPLEAESSLLAAMLLDRQVIEQVRRLIRPEAFYRVPHQLIFRALVSLYDSRRPVDTVTLCDELSRRDDLAAVGGYSFISQIMEYATTAANAAAHAAIVRDAHARREVLHLGLEVQAQAADPTTDTTALLADVRTRTDALVASHGHTGSESRFAAAATSAVDLCTQDIPAPRSLLGDGVLTAGGFAILYGKPGLGKSWLALELALSLVRGAPWLGVPTSPEGARVGLLQLELPAHTLQTRLRSLGVGAEERDEVLVLVCRPTLRGAVDLRQPGESEAVREWIKRDCLDLLIVDALSRAHTASENKAEELAPVLADLDAMRHESGCAILLVHHERKSAAGAGTEDDHDALRGSSRLQSDPTLLIRVKQTAGGLRSVTFVKVSEGATPDPIHFRIGGDGRPEVVGSPTSLGDANRERVASAVLDAPRPVQVSDLVTALRMSVATVKRHLAALLEAKRIERIGENKATRYVAATSSPAQPAQSGTRAGESPISANALDDSPPPHQLTSTNEGPKGTSSPAHTGSPFRERASELVTCDPPSSPAAQPPPLEYGSMELLLAHGWEPIPSSTPDPGQPP